MSAAGRHERLLTFLIVVAFVVAIGAVQIIANRANDRDARNAVAACERGNEIRDYLAFDNGERIGRIEQQLANPAQITPGDVRDFRAELTRRYVQRERLVPFPCETLR